MRNLRIIFMGTPDFAVATLQALVQANYPVVGVITAPDKPAGRGRKIKESAVKQYAKSLNLNILQPTNLKADSFISELKKLEANLQIVVAFRMLPKIVWQMPKYGTFNLHASLLPNYRGAAPINWAIINGETKTGVTTFFIDEKIDTGAIILQEETNITANETAGQLHDKLMHLGSKVVMDTVEKIKLNQVKTKVQPEQKTKKTAYKLNKENCKINWQDSLTVIHNKIRGLSPYPGAWCTLKNNEETLNIKIYKTSIEFQNHQMQTGTVFSTKNEIKIAAKNGYIHILELQLPGKRIMDARTLLNGYTFTSSAILK